MMGRRTGYGPTSRQRRRTAQPAQEFTNGEAGCLTIGGLSFGLLFDATFWWCLVPLMLIAGYFILLSSLWLHDQFSDGPAKRAHLLNQASNFRTFQRVTSQRQALDAAKVKVRKAVNSHIDMLANKRRSLLRSNEYGIVNYDAWNSEVQRFVSKIVEPDLTHDEKRALSDTDAGEPIWDELIDDVVSSRVRSSEIHLSASLYRDDFSAVDFENWCAAQLRTFGWTAETTVCSGDQGADVVASKDGQRVVIQCKRYGVPVGNKAVQEAYSAKAHYGANRAAVIATNGYTTSAKALALSTGVVLLAHSELSRL